MRCVSTLIPLLICTLLSAGCDAGGDPSPDGPPAPAAALDPDGPPVTAGAWARPAPGATWQWQLQGQVNTSYDADLYDVDLFDTPGAVFAALKADGRFVLCYFSAGSGEAWRPDYEQLPSATLGRPLDGWPGERWLDIRAQPVVDLMMARLDRAVARGCDGVEPDNVTAYHNETGFAITARDQLAFNRHLANEAHRRGLAIALKNDGEQAGELVAYFDLALNEECHAYDECTLYEPFERAGKPVFNAEYPGSQAAAGA